MGHLDVLLVLYEASDDEGSRRSCQATNKRRWFDFGLLSLVLIVNSRTSTTTVLGFCTGSPAICIHSTTHCPSPFRWTGVPPRPAGPLGHLDMAMLQDVPVQKWRFQAKGPFVPREIRPNYRTRLYPGTARERFIAWGRICTGKITQGQPSDMKRGSLSSPSCERHEHQGP